MVLASLAPHLQLADSPIDIIKFQGDHLTCSQSQSGEQEEDSAIAEGGWAVLLVSMDNLLDLFRGAVLWKFGEPPIRHARNRPSKIALRLPAQEEESKERAQCGHHHLGHSGAARVSVSQEESRDVVGRQVSDTDRCVPKAFDDETPGELPVMGDRYRGKTAFFLEVVLILLAERRQWGLVDHRFWRSNYAVHTQVVQEVASSLWITIPEVSIVSLFFKKVVDDSILQIDESQASSYEPPIEDVQKPQPLLHSFSGITQLGKRSDKRVQVRAK